jgi:hypothetical protein
MFLGLLRLSMSHVRESLTRPSIMTLIEGLQYIPDTLCCNISHHSIEDEGHHSLHWSEGWEFPNQRVQLSSRTRDRGPLNTRPESSGSGLIGSLYRRQLL